VTETDMGRKPWHLLVRGLLLATFGCHAAGDGSKAAPHGRYGDFVGEVQCAWCDESRHMELVSDFEFIAPSGERWTAPAGSVIDGASIPRVAWSVVGGPYTGRYRRAAVLHDVACVQRARSSFDTHRMFYYACRAAGVGRGKAAMMYYAVQKHGPHWELPAKPLANPDCERSGKDPAADASAWRSFSRALSRTAGDPVADARLREELEEVLRFAEAEDPTLDELDEFEPEGG